MSDPVTINAVCGNCIYWRLVELRGPVEINAPKRGNCFALPPTPCAVFGQDRRTVIGQVNIRPAMMDNDTCGMFMPKPELLPEGAHS